MEEVEFLLLRCQAIVTQCQAEKVPTFSAIPIWLQQLRGFLRVYEDDDEMVRQYKENTLQVNALFAALILSFDSLNYTVAVCVCASHSIHASCGLSR
jgi:hypothetical protein